MRTASPCILPVHSLLRVSRCLNLLLPGALWQKEVSGAKAENQVDCPKPGTSSSHHIHNHLVWRRIRSLLLQRGKCQISSAPCLRLLTAMSHYSWRFWREPKPEKYCSMSLASDTCSLWWDSREHIIWPCPIQRTRQFWFKTDNTYMFSSLLAVVSLCTVLCTPFIYFICLFTKNTG